MHTWSSRSQNRLIFKIWSIWVNFIIIMQMSICLFMGILFLHSLDFFCFKSRNVAWCKDEGSIKSTEAIL